MRTVIGFFSLLTVWASIASAEPAKKPNVVVILADDLGYADLGCQGSKEVKSPNIDSIAANGVRCTAGYVSAPQCCPSRAGLMTGRYQNRFGFEANWPGPLSGQAGLPVDQRTVAQSFKAAGYATGMIGKWHLGDAEPMRPYNRGFSETFWNPNGGILFPEKATGFLRQMFRNAEPVQVAEYSTDAFGREAVAFIDRHRAEPFFLYLAFVPPHWPMEAKPEHLAQYAHVPDLHRRTMLGMMASLDENVGRVLAKLRESTLEDNTLVFFLSDNGGPTGRARPQPDADFEFGQNTSKNDPFRGVKGDLLEGGIRVPFLVQWKGRLPQGKTFDRPVISLDIFPTALAAAGIAAPPDVALDGTDILPFLSGQKQGDPHATLFWRFRFPPNQPAFHRWAIRQGDWKLVKNHADPVGLYDLAADPGETKNLAEAQPDRARAMEAAWREWNVQLKEPLWTDVKPGAAKKPLTKKIGHQAEIIFAPTEIQIHSTGNDPQAVFGEIPESTGPYTLEMRIRSNSSGMGQVFWATAAEPKFAEARSVRFEPIHDGATWWDFFVQLENAKERVTEIRLDPSAGPGLVRISRLVLKDAQGNVVKKWIGEPAKAPAAKPRGDLHVAAYYFPQWHVDPINKARRGGDWTEWELLPKAKPRFEGHKQPKVPVWGYEMEDDPAVMAKKIDAAADHGVDAFLFDWYYNAAGPFLQGALDRGFLNAKNNARLKFAVMWANHDLSNGCGAVSEEVFVRATDHMIKNYFGRPNYWRVNGGIFVSIYEVQTLIEGLGGVDATAAVLQRFRERVRAAGHGELHLSLSSSKLAVPKSEWARYPGLNAMLRKLGIDSISPYHWVHLKAIPTFPASDYAAYRDASFEIMRQRADSISAAPYLPVACMGWDASPRTPQDKPFEQGAYPRGAVLVNNTPAEFAKALALGTAWLDARPAMPNVLLIEAWNEWTEGSYLEPDAENGMKYLEAIRQFKTK